MPAPQNLYKLAELYQVPYELLMELAGYPVPKTQSGESQFSLDAFAARVGTVTEEEEEAYAVLIDKVIEQLGREGTGPPNPDQKRLGQLLIDASDQGLESQSLEALTLDSLLRSNTGEPFAGLKGLGECLLSSTLDQRDNSRYGITDAAACEGIQTYSGTT